MSLFTLKDRTVRMYSYTDSTLASVATEKEFKEQRGKELTYQKGFNLKAFFPAFVTQPITFNTDKNKVQDLVELKEVKKIGFDFNMNLGVELGISRAFLQPWFMEPAKISIEGASYIGAFNGLDTATDDDVQQTYNLFIRRFAELKGDRRQIVLEVVNNPQDAQRFIGYITRFTFDESVDNPYILNYQISFQGKPDIFISDAKGKETNKADKKVVKA